MFYSSTQRLVWPPGTRVIGKYFFRGRSSEVSFLMILSKIDLCLREWWPYKADWLGNIYLFFLCKLEHTKAIRYYKKENLFETVLHQFIMIFNKENIEKPFFIEFLQFLLCNLRYKRSNWTDLERLTESVYLL